MKKIFFFSMFALLLYSCGNEELSYSCDPEIDVIVKSAVIEFSTISLTEFLEYDIQLQKAIYRSFLPEKKRSFWLEKLEYLIATSEFSDAELVHIEELESQILLISFELEQLDSDGFKEQKIFENNWREHAKEILSWDDTKISFIVNSLCITNSQYEQLVVEQKEITINSLGGSCSCSTESDYCSDYLLVCGGSGECTISSGCGWFWKYDCDGYCQ